MNKSEKIVYTVCKSSFLSFWSFVNPIREDNEKELTDILVINDPYIIIISVKDINIEHSGDINVDRQRWYKRAIKKSYQQLYGAERILKNSLTKILTSDQKYLINIPEEKKAKIYRIGISIGRREQFALPFGNFESGFVHFFDQYSFPILLNELDTITDFIEYIKAKERFFVSGKNALFRSEEDLLALYLHGGRNFPSKFDRIMIKPLIWTELCQKSEFHRRKDQEKKSYVWDKIIEEFFKEYSKEQLLFNSNFSQTEQSLRAMSKESRFSRRILAESFLEAIGFYGTSWIKARMVQSMRGTIYIFLIDEHREVDRMQRMWELQLRCMVARNIIDLPEVVGIATNRYIKGGGHSYDLCYTYLPELTDEKRTKLLEMQNDLGYFVNSKKSNKHFDEYPK